MLQHNPVERTKKYRRYFEKTANTSVAASAEETLLSKSGEAIVIREINISSNGDDATGSMSSRIKITLDGVEILNATLADVYSHYGVETPNAAQPGIVHLLKYASNTRLCSIKISMDSNIVTSLLVEFTNADVTNACSTGASLIYDIEI